MNEIFACLCPEAYRNDQSCEQSAVPLDLRVRMTVRLRPRVS